MGVATPSIFSHHSSNKSSLAIQTAPSYSSLKSMSQDYNPGIFNFPGNGFDLSSDEGLRHQVQVQQHHVAQQIHQDKMWFRGIEPMAGVEEEPANLCETAGMLSEMFNFPSGSGGSGGWTDELLDHSILASGGLRTLEPPPWPLPPPPRIGGDWYSKSQSGHHTIHTIPCRNTDSSAAMKLFLVNPQARSPSPPLQPSTPASSAFHMLHCNPSPSSSLQGLSISSIAALGPGFTACGSVIAPPLPPPPQQFAFGGGGSNPEISSLIQSQGLSLSLSSSLQQLEAAKPDELTNMGSDCLLFNSQGANSSAASFLTRWLYKPSFIQSQNHPVNVGIGYSTFLGPMNVLRTSKYHKAAQELLEEFCSVGRGHFKKTKFGRLTNPNSSSPSISRDKNNSGGAAAPFSSTSKENPPLSAADRMEHQRRKAKLSSMLDEVDRRYNHYCEQMQMVVNLLDLVMGYGAAVPYTALTRKAMSRHFRCLRDALSVQLKHSFEQLGERDGPGTSGIKRGETPRLKILDQSFRRQRELHDPGILAQEPWRPQRGLPECSINILRAWLFKHFLHPYPSDNISISWLDGLASLEIRASVLGFLSGSRDINSVTLMKLDILRPLTRPDAVANWFINARVRLWKPMVEEMYQQEAEEEETDQEGDRNPSGSIVTAAIHDSQGQAASTKRPKISATESDPSVPSPASLYSKTPLQSNDNGRHPSSSTTAAASSLATAATVVASTMLPGLDPGHFPLPESANQPSGGFSPNHGAAGNVDMAPALIRFGSGASDVSLTLGLRHAGNLPDKNPFSVTDFGDC